MYVGIDVSKEWVDVAVRPGDEGWRASRDEKGMESLVQRLQALRPQLVVMEATGGYEAPVWRRWGGYPLRGKPTSGEGLCPFPGDTGEDGPTRRRCNRPLWGGKRRRGTGFGICPGVGVVRSYRCRRMAVPTVRRSIGGDSFLDSQLKALDDDLGRRLRKSPLWRERETLLKSVPGIGPVDHQPASGSARVGNS